MEEKTVTVNSKDWSIPRNLNVFKLIDSRVAELEALHSIISNRLNSDFRSERSKRRRTTSHDNKASRKRSNKRRRLVSDDPNSKKDEKKSSRKMRRRVELKMNSEIGFSASGDGTKRLRTHVWHAKRFAMTKCWGFHLPLGVQGRGKGSRALLKRYKNGVLVHDASYYVAIQLEGPEDSLITALRMVLVPSTPSHSGGISHAIISGQIYGRAILHHVGAPFSNAIAPVTYMWRPYHCQNKEYTAVNHTSGIFKKIQDTDTCSTSTVRRIWVWLHASAFSEGYDALKLACQKEMDDKNIPIHCSSLEGQLAKLEVFGSKAFQLLQEILHPVTCTSQSLWQLNKHTGPEGNSHLKNSSNLENENYIPSHGVISITCKDPRLLIQEKIADVQESALKHKSDDFSVTPSNHPDSSSNNEVWDASSGVSPPVEDSVLCAARHQARMSYLFLDEPCLEILKDSSTLQCLRTCPILLLNENDERRSLDRWSIVLPISWVKAFWMPLVSRGARAIGLRERHWIACEMGLPSFPWDFPDCSAYWQFMAKEAAAADDRAERSNPATRPFKFPIPPPWHSVQLTLTKGPDGVGTYEVSTDENTAGNSLSSFKGGNCNATPVGDHHGNSFDGIVPRTSSLLIDFLNDMHLGHVPLFPQGQDKKLRILEFLKSKSAQDRCKNNINQVRYSRRLCFLRVLLHACKQGVFEEGAVICAPNTSDLSLWASRSENSEKGLKISESAVRHYFIEKSSSMWELQLPEDAAARESHRWPIGFVTTGFVQGSKKPVAEGFCEASLLASLREQQWEGMLAKQKEEIYVLIRNLRSSAYRIALATIFLEQQEDDLEFM